MRCRIRISEKWYKYVEFCKLFEENKSNHTKMKSYFKRIVILQTNITQDKNHNKSTKDELAFMED